ncbi:hypothetical protein [Streptomyces sp. NRRL F-5123]|uniref:hypothetical protein n=1 Tax=Streptomyces sp. NRRL F-5123 TaxID=1463856 RepID=UPI0007C4F163|nr:hypothetical protein [Streptomyces sp. NRRL F-5123]
MTGGRFRVDDGRRDEDGRLVAVLDELADRTGLPVGDADNGHDRWRLYEAALGEAENFGLLFEVIWFEPDQNVALSVLLPVLERLPEGERARWIAQLRWEYSREYAQRYARDVALLQSAALTPLLADGEVQESWSDWLQVRLAQASPEPAVLRRLGERGRTKRIRGYASSRLAALDRAAVRGECS